ncbi:hypothetical protein [Novosphingobium sp. 9U]|uniref:hypothetical protein n=1 Tax=Novosphingobium sp. 9U TaxID=2653158 RepID=UPI0012F151DB|nr:hypothetical protein [Novosphingobium sp. 9U]VWX47981.1 exported hypothetical protein [Novosphingobium sp. 9U]
MIKNAILAAAALASAAFAPQAAQAATTTIPAHSTKLIEIAANRSFVIHARGFDDTDLDFRVISPVGRTVHVDVDGTSYTDAYIDADSAGTYRFYVQNVGDEANAVNYTVEYID